MRQAILAYVACMESAALAETLFNKLETTLCYLSAYFLDKTSSIVARLGTLSTAAWYTQPSMQGVTVTWDQH